jgi:hypothetical protein
MKRFIAGITLTLALMSVVGCKAAGGAAAGAGISSVTGGDVKQGAVLGGSIGAIMEVMD